MSHIVAIALVFILVVIAYAGAIGSPFQFDDTDCMADNQLIRSPRLIFDTPAALRPNVRASIYNRIYSSRLARFGPACPGMQGEARPRRSITTKNR